MSKVSKSGNLTSKLADRVKQLQSRSIDKQLLDILKQCSQLPDSSLSESQKHNLEKASSAGTVFVVSGQQTGLFGGPLLTLYKAFSVVEFAAQAEKELEANVVPLFWIQSEDHDLAESDSFRFFSENERLSTITLHPEFHDRNKRSLGSVTIGAEVRKSLSVLKEALGHLEHYEKLADIIEQSYQPEATYAGAFAEFMLRIFRDDGLLLVDPRQIHKKGLSKEIFGTSILKRREITDSLLQHRNELAKAGVAEQVFVRENSPLLFIHPEGPGSSRYRVEEEDGTFHTIGDSSKSYSKDELLTLIDTKSEHFSTSALLRPIMQDFLFPTLCYFAGEAEQQYLKQSAAAAKAFGVDPAPIVPRLSFWLLNKKQSRLLEALEIDLTELEAGPEAVKEKISIRDTPEDLKPESIAKQSQSALDEIIDNYKQAFEKSDKTLLGALESAKKKIRYQFENLDTKYRRALGNRDSVNEDRVQKLYHSLYPNGTAQEREISALYFLMMIGVSELKTLLRKHCSFDNQNPAIVPYE